MVDMTGLESKGTYCKSRVHRTSLRRCDLSSYLHIDDTTQDNQTPYDVAMAKNQPEMLALWKRRSRVGQSSVEVLFLGNGGERQSEDEASWWNSPETNVFAVPTTPRGSASWL